MFDAYQKLNDTLRKIQNGDLQLREQFIDEYKPFVLKTTANFCKKSLGWGRDDELSVSLIAFNSSIDTFDLDRGIPFLPYSRLVIANRLRDYYRKESRHLNQYPLEIEVEDGMAINPGVIKQAWQEYRERTIEDERQEELERYERLLSRYNITFEDLVKSSPKHRDSRLTLFRVARVLATHPLLLEYLESKGQLPLKELVEQTAVSRKTLERGRKFIIASALIASRPQEFIYLRAYIKFEA